MEKRVNQMEEKVKETKIPGGVIYNAFTEILHARDNCMRSGDFGMEGGLNIALYILENHVRRYLNKEEKENGKRL